MKQTKMLFFYYFFILFLDDMRQKSKTEEEHFTLGTVNKKIENFLPQVKSDHTEPIPTVSEECYDTTESVSKEMCETVFRR